MGESDQEKVIDFSAQPRSVFVAFLIWQMKAISTSLFMGGKFSQAISSMRSLISCLDKESRKVLKPTLDRLSRYEANINEIKTKVEAEELYRAITTRLHETYLKELRYPRLEKRDFDAMETEDS